jgi:hypothetical protein
MAVKVYFAPAPLQYQSEIEMQTYQPIWVEIKNTIFGLEDFSITYRKANADDSSNNVTQESISKELEFYDGAYTFIHEQLVTQRREFIYVKLVNDCEGCEPLLHFGVIKRKNLKSCDCDEAYRAQINGISRDEIIKARLESILAYNDYSVVGNDLWLFECVQERLNRNGVEQGFGVPSVSIRKIFDSITSLLNINAYSSIFYEYNAMMNWTGDDYSPTVIPQGQNIYNPYYYTSCAYKPLTNVLQKDVNGRNAYRVGLNNLTLIAIENRLSWSMFRFLNNLADVFNANWRVKNGVLEFERKDFFYLNANQWLDLSEFKACYSIKDFGDWGYLDISYGGNKLEVDSSWFDNTMAEFFIGAGLNQIGSVIFNKHLLYQDAIIDWFDSLSFTQRNGLIKKFEFGYHPILRYTVPDKLGLKDGMTNLPLLIIKRQNSAINRAFPWAGTGVIAHQPMAVSKFDLNGGIMKETLYDNFHFIDDPLQRPNSKGYFSKGAQFFYEFEKNNIPFSCENFANFDINKTIMTKKGSAIMDEVEFNWSKKTMNIKGRV